MLAIIERFQTLSAQERVNFRVGRRTGIYRNLDDLNDAPRRELVEQTIHRLSKGDNEVDDKTIHTLMERFI